MAGGGVDARQRAARRHRRGRRLAPLGARPVVVDAVARELEPHDALTRKVRRVLVVVQRERDVVVQEETRVRPRNPCPRRLPRRLRVLVDVGDGEADAAVRPDTPVGVEHWGGGGIVGVSE